MKDFRNSLIKLVEDLNKNPHVEVQKDYIGEPVFEETYDMVTKHHQVTLSSKLHDFYYKMSSSKINWSCDLEVSKSIRRYSEDDNIINGEIHIRPIEQFLVFDKKMEATWWKENLSEEEIKDLYNFRYFDFNDDYIRVGFIIEEKKINDDKMYFIVQESSGFSPTGLSFEQYLDKIIEYKGFQGWQYNYFFQNTENYKRMMFYLDQLF